MKYECELTPGQHLEIDNEGDQTFVSLSNRGLGQQQSQGHGFTTGQWSSEPTVFRVGKDVIVRVETGAGSRFLRVEGNHTTLLDRAPELENAEQVALHESKASTWKPMEAMKPMRPMEPMEPMEPMKPMQPMRPMN